MKLAQQMEAADEAATDQLLAEVKKYNQLLNQVKGAAYGQSQR
jgi:hypothetical protein